MKWTFSNDADQPIDEQIASVLQEMTNVGVPSDDYPKYMKYLEQLNAIKAKRRKSPVSRDTIAIVLGNIGISLIIVLAEERHVITSKAMGQLMRTKLET